jgi:hypothetical protein
MRALFTPMTPIFFFLLIAPSLHAQPKATKAVKKLSAAQKPTFEESKKLLLSFDSENQASGLNQLEILVLEETLDKKIIFDLIARYLQNFPHNHLYAVRAVEIADQLSSDAEWQESREAIYHQYFLLFRKPEKYNLFVREIDWQFRDVVGREPAMAVRAVQDERLSAMAHSILRVVGERGWLSNCFDDLNQLIESQSSDKSAAGIRDSARLALAEILVREMKYAERQKDFSLLHKHAEQSLRLLIETRFETRGSVSATSGQTQFTRKFLEYFSFQMQSAHRPEVLAVHYDQFVEILNQANDQRSDLIDFRLGRIFGEIGQLENIPDLEKVAQRADKHNTLFRESIYGMEVTDGTGNKIRSGGAINRILKRHEGR